MALIRTSAVVGAVSGNIGGVNFANTKGSTVARAARRPAGSQTRAQSEQSSRVAGAVNAWNRLPDSMRRAWKNFAEAQPKESRLGEKRPISGYALYVEHALEAWQGDPPENFEPPSVVIHLAPLSVTVAPVSPENVPVATERPDGIPHGTSMFQRVWLQRFLPRGQTANFNRAFSLGLTDGFPLSWQLTEITDPLDIQFQEWERIAVGVQYAFCRNTFGHIVWDTGTIPGD